MDNEIRKLQELAGIQPATVEAIETDEDYIEEPRDEMPDEDNKVSDCNEEDLDIDEMADMPPGPALPDVPMPVASDEFTPVEEPETIGVPAGDVGLPTGEVSFQIEPYSDTEFSYDGLEDELMVGEDYDFQNGYDEQTKVDDDEYFPSGATSNVKKKKGPWPAQADNKLFVEESAKIRKRLITEYKKFKGR